MSIKIAPFTGQVMAYCENQHSGVGLSVQFTPDEARFLARQLLSAADDADTREFGKPVGQSGAWWGKDFVGKEK